MNDFKLDFDRERILLRPLKIIDEKDILINVRDKNIVKWTNNIPWPYPDDGARKFIRKTNNLRKKKMEFTFGSLKEI